MPSLTDVVESSEDRSVVGISRDRSVVGHLINY